MKLSICRTNASCDYTRVKERERERERVSTARPTSRSVGGGANHPSICHLSVCPLTRDTRRNSQRRTIHVARGDSHLPTVCTLLASNALVPTRTYAPLSPHGSSILQRIVRLLGAVASDAAADSSARGQAGRSY